MNKIPPFRKAIAPYVDNKLKLAENARETGDLEAEFSHLEDAHVLGQASTYYHTLVHWKMFQYGLRHALPKEMLGQVLRLIGAITKTAFGLLPKGNTGGANVSPFKPMPLSSENQSILDNINNA